MPAPKIDVLKLERFNVEVDEAAVEQQLNQLASSQTRFEDAKKGHKAVLGDQVTIDFVGKVDGVAFDGGTGTDMPVVLGSGQLIPGFEDQLVGVKTGDESRSRSVSRGLSSRESEGQAGHVRHYRQGCKGRRRYRWTMSLPSSLASTT